VSPLWRNEIGVYLAPHRPTIARLARGIRSKWFGTTGWSGELDTDAQWQPSLGLLDAMLAEAEWQGSAARVVISDRWVRYAMVPYAAALGSASEQLTHARHVFAGIYGEVVDQWTVTLADSRPGIPRVACAVPTTFIEELSAILTRRKIPLKSLQPQLVCAYNHWRAQLPDGGAWFVSIEPGSLAAARLGTGGWDRVHSVRIGADWATELRRLQTFGRLASVQAHEGRVYVDAPAELRSIAGARAADLIWLEDTEVAQPAAGRLKLLRRLRA
jgi:hypothetical protein